MAVPIIYPYLGSVLNPWWTSPATENSLDFSITTDMPLSPIQLLAFGSAAMQLAKQGNYTGAENILSLMGRLPSNMEHNLQTFITLERELISLLQSTGTGIDELKGLVEDGAVTLGMQKAAQIDGLIANATDHLSLISSALDRVVALYRVDVSHQRADLQALATVLQGYESALAQLKVLLQEVDQRTETTLNMSVSSNPVWVEDNFTVTGQLTSNGVGLGGRVIDVLFYIAGVGTTDLQAHSDQFGGFSRSYHVSNSSRPTSILVFARYAPRGVDLSVLRPARSVSVNVVVRYYPANLTLAASSSRVHVVEGFTVQGMLTGRSGEPLASESVQLVVDNSTELTVRTDASGAYSARMSFPNGTRQGTHVLYALFNPTSGILATTPSSNVPVQIYYLTPTVTLAESQLILLSGQSFQVRGVLEVDSKPLSGGVVVAILGDQQLSRTISNAQGAFNMTLASPIGATGDNVLQIVYVPQASWFLTGSSSMVLRIFNSAVVGVGLSAVLCVGVLVSGSSFGSEQKAETIIVPPKRRETEEIPEEPQSTVEVRAPPGLVLRVADLRALKDARSCVRETYWSVRQILAATLREPGRLSETHREFERRVVQRLGQGVANTFSALSQLFELAEYSQHPLSTQDANAAINDAILVSEELNVKVLT
jgi:hypothetical protein